MARGFSIQDIACITISLQQKDSSSSLESETELSLSPTVESSVLSPNNNCGLQHHFFQESPATCGLQQQQLFFEEQLNCQATMQQQQRSSSSSEPSNNDDKTETGGPMLSPFSWFDKQRERRRREHLKLEAEKQLQKIGEAHRASLRQSSNASVTSLSLAPNRSLADSASSCSTEDFDEVFKGIGGSSTTSDSKQQQQQDYLHRPSNSFGTSDVSKSGEGASGMLSLNDIDGICGPMSNRKGATTRKGDDDDDDIIGPVRVTKVEGDEASPYILSQTQMDEISKHVLPETIKYCRWRRLYGLGRDGDSFDGCLRIIGSSKRTLMVVRTTKGDVFGGYADAPWHSRHDSSTAKFYGSASSCLYSFRSSSSSSIQPTSTPTSTSTTPYCYSTSPDDSPLNVYRWTGKNRYIQVCDVSNKMLAFGGGGDKGAFGLCLQEDFQRGTTGHCDTFDNDPLTPQRTFDICDVEFWEFLTGVF